MLYEPWAEVECQTETEFWDRVIMEFDEARVTLQSVHYETREEAKSKRYPSSFDPADLRPDSLFVHRFRRTDDHENILYFREMGSLLLEKVDRLIDQRRATPEFVACWGKLMLCVGFVSVGQFATGNDAGSLLAGERGGEAVSKDRYKRWLAKILLDLYTKHQNLTKARAEVTDYLNALRDQPSISAEVKDYATEILNDDGELKSTYAGRFSLDAIKQYAAMPDEGAPPRPGYDVP